jgi:hypothetical protein
MIGPMSEWWQADDEAVLAALGDAQSALNVSYVRMLGVVQEAQRRGLADGHGYSDTADLLRGTQNLTRSEARARVRDARQVLPERSLTGTPLPAELPATSRAVVEAAISAEHIHVIQGVLALLPPHLEMHRAGLEVDLAHFARTLDPDALRRVGKAALARLDPDGPAPRHGDPTRTRFALVPRGKGFDVRGWFDTESAAVLRTALSPLAAPTPAADGLRDQRSIAERQGDAVVELARRALDAGTLPLEGGERPHVTVTVPLEVLEGRLGTAVLDFGEGTLESIISAEDARRYACDAHVVPIVLGTNGEPLDVGRETRVVNRAMRRALAQRDGGCAFPGCECPAQWADAHHIVFWGRGGITALENLVLLCPRHHTVIHREEWRITMEPDGFPLFHPPPWIPGGPRRNSLHRPDLAGTAQPAPPGERDRVFAAV